VPLYSSSGLNLLYRGLQELRWMRQSFYHIPAVLENQGEKTLQLSSKRRQEWIARINRKDWVPSKYARVCSDHFVSGMLGDR